MERQAAELAARRWSGGGERAKVVLRPLGGGLESEVASARVVATSEGTTARRFVIKRLRGERRRESQVYRALWKHWKAPPIARVLGVESMGETEYLFLEYLRPSAAWPWSDSTTTAAVCEALARLHDAGIRDAPSAGWDYEAELADSAAETLATAVRMRSASGERFWFRLGDLRYAVAALPCLRDRLRDSERTLIHGDLHPGNVIVQESGGERRVRLIDWGRARAGSPLEDIASWLHSLGCWEPCARRRHHRFLRLYLESRAVPRSITPGLRRDYWLACLSNGLAGAIRYHLAVVGDAARSEREHAASRSALRAWQRVVRHATGLLRASRAG